MDATMYYKAVGVADLQTATKAQISKGYKKLAMAYHPDRCADKDKATRVMAIIGEARDREFERREEIAEFGVAKAAPVRKADGSPGNEKTVETAEHRARRKAGQEALRRKKREAKKCAAKKGKKTSSSKGSKRVGGVGLAMRRK